MCMYVALLNYVAKPNFLHAIGMKDNVFHVMVNLGIPLSNTQEMIEEGSCE